MTKVSKFSKKIVISIFVILLYFIWPFVSDFVLGLFGISYDSITNVGTSMGQFISYMIMNFILMGILMVIYFRSLKSDFVIFKSKFSSYWKLILKYVGLTFLSVIGVNLLKIFVFQIDINTGAENDMALYNYFMHVPWAMFFMTTVYYPIVEELVFSKSIRDLTHNKWLFIIVSSLFFWYFNIAFIGINYVTIVSSLSYFVIAFIRCYAYDKTDNVCVPISIKVLYNLIVNIFTLLGMAGL